MSDQDIIIADLRFQIAETQKDRHRLLMERDEERHLADIRGELLTKTEAEVDDLRRKIDCGTHDEDGCGSCSRCLACVKNAHDSLLDRVKFTLRQLGKAQAEAQHLRNQTENDTAKIYDLRRQLDASDEEQSLLRRRCDGLAVSLSAAEARLDAARAESEAEIDDLRRQLDRMREERDEALNHVNSNAARCHELIKERDEARADLARIRARMPSGAELQALRMVINAGVPRAEATSWLARQEDDNAKRQGAELRAVADQRAAIGAAVLEELERQNDYFGAVDFDAGVYDEAGFVRAIAEARKTGGL